MADTKKTIPFPFDPENPELNKISSLVTYPDVGSLVDADNGRIYESAIGFPYANTKSVPNDWSCMPCPGKENMPEYDNISFGIQSGQDVSVNGYYSPAYPVKIVQKDNSYSIVFPLKSINLGTDGNGTIGLYPSDGGDTFFDAFGSSAELALVPNGYDTLDVTGLNELSVTMRSETDHVLDVSIGELVNPFEIDLDKYAVDTVSLRLQLVNNMALRLAYQEDPSQNGVYEYANGVLTRLSTDVNALTPESSVPLEYDESSTDNVTVCITQENDSDGVVNTRLDHFRKDYGDREIHDFLVDKVGTQMAFGYSPTDKSKTCAGKLIQWLTTSGKVDIGNGSGFPVFVNGFGLGEVYSGLSTVSNGTPETESEDDVYHPVLRWGIGTKRSARTDSNVLALARDWPFTQLTGHSAVIADQVNDNNHITLVRKAVLADESTRGNLEYEEELANQPDDAETPVMGKFYMNKHNLTIYTQYEDYHGDIVIKPTFVHLPVPLDTKDGETIEVSVSLVNDLSNIPTVNASNLKKYLSCYYASISQPRVYVTSGSQKFSNKRLKINTITINDQEPDSFDVVTQGRASRLRVGDQVRANITSSGDPSQFTALGEVTAISDEETTIHFDRRLPYDVHRNTWNAIKDTFYICGMAYLDKPGETGVENFTEPNNPTETSLGVIARTNGVLKGDAGEGGEGDLDEFNKFFSIDQADGRTVVGGEQVDRRDVIASVYQTAVSTFPWRLAHRRKMNHLDELLTDEMIASSQTEKALFQQIWESNQNIIKSMADTTLITNRGHYKSTPSKSPVSYETEVSGEWTLADVLQIANTVLKADAYGLVSEANTQPNGNPVRQAQKLAAQYANDFRLSRLVNRDLSDMQVTRIGFGSSYTELPAASSTIDTTALTKAAGESDAVYRYRMSTLPEYVMGAARYSPSVDDFYTDSTYLNLDHWLSVDDYFEAHSCDSVLGSTGDTHEPNTVPVKPGVCRNYGMEHSVSGIFRSPINRTHRQLMNELARRIELNSVFVAPNRWDPRTGVDYLSNWYYPFVDLSSPDGIAALHDIAMNESSETGTSYDDLNLSEAQYPYASVDPGQMYKYEVADTTNDPVNFISVPMPAGKSPLLTRFIEYFVAAYAADMDKHLYRGIRVGLPGLTVPANTSETYVKHFYRVAQSDDDGLHEPMNSAAYYIDDLFADIDGQDVMDFNYDEMWLNGRFSVDASVAPYRTRQWWQLVDSETAMYNPTYTRVFMQFTFSQRAGRWFTTDYRQTPTTYLSPLYGADALKQEMRSVYNEDGTIALTDKSDMDSSSQFRPLWHNPACAGFDSYKSAMYLPYSMYPAMDMTLGCVPYLWTTDESTSEDWMYKHDGTLKDEWTIQSDNQRPPIKRLRKPYHPMHTADGKNEGIGLYPPSNSNGEYNPLTDGGPHANFWSVRRYLRPAVTVLDGTDIPTVEDEHDLTKNNRVGGDPSDPTLFRMFNSPRKDEVEYSIPDVVDPREDVTGTYILYGQDKVEEDKHVLDYEGRLLMKPTYDSDGVYYVGYALGDDDQELSGDPDNNEQNGG